MTKDGQTPESRSEAIRSSGTVDSEERRPKRYDWLAHPLFVTIIGGVLVALLTLLWQDRQKWQEISLAHERAIIAQQINLLTDLPIAFNASAGALNGWFTKFLWIAEERNGNGDESKINTWGKEIRELDKKFHSASPDGLLNLASYLFRCKNTKNAAQDLRINWVRFQEYFQTLNRNFNKNQRLANDKIEEAKQFRRSTIDSINQLTRNLWNEMGREVDPTRERRDPCN